MQASEQIAISGQRLLHAFQQEGGFDFVNRRESPALTRLRREATGWMSNLEKALFHLPKGKMIGALSCYPFIFQATKGRAMDGSTLMHHYLRIFDSMMRGDGTVSEPELYSALRQTESLNLRLRYPARLEAWLESTKQRWTTLYRNILSSQEESPIDSNSLLDSDSLSKGKILSEGKVLTEGKAVYEGKSFSEGKVLSEGKILSKGKIFSEGKILDEGKSPSGCNSLCGRSYSLSEYIGIAAILIKEDLSPAIPDEREEEQFKERTAQLYLPLLESPGQWLETKAWQSGKSEAQPEKIIESLIRFNQSLCNNLLTFSETLQNEHRLRSLLKN